MSRGPKSDKIWADAVRKAVHEYHEQADDAGKVKKTRKLSLLAKNLVDAGINGDMQAIKEIGDRLDGKNTTLNVNGNHTVHHQSESISETAEWLAGLTAAGADSKVEDTRH